MINIQPPEKAELIRFETEYPELGRWFRLLTNELRGAVKASHIDTTTLTPIVNWERADDGAVATGTTVIPNDNTIPQNTEGDEYITVSITPKSTTNKLIIESLTHISHTVDGRSVAALFKDSDASALKTAIGVNGAATTIKQLSISHEMVAGTTSTITFKIRAGGTVAGTTTFNGSSGTGKFNGTMNSYIKVTEYLQ